MCIYIYIPQLGKQNSYDFLFLLWLGLATFVFVIFHAPFLVSLIVIKGFLRLNEFVYCIKQVLLFYSLFTAFDLAEREEHTGDIYIYM